MAKIAAIVWGPTSSPQRISAKQKFHQEDVEYERADTRGCC